jgi:hypothetical protein
MGGTDPLPLRTEVDAARDAFLAGLLVELLRKGGLKELAYASTVASCGEFGGRLLQPDR